MSQIINGVYDNESEVQLYLINIFCLHQIYLLPLSVDPASTVSGLLSIFHEQELTETIHDTDGHGYLATFVGKNGR